MSEPGPPLELTYESAVAEPVGRRPKWVWAIVAVYLLVFGAILLQPLWAKLSSPDDITGLVIATIASCLTALCGLGLVFTPVRIGRRRPITRGNVWIPIVTSGFLAGALALGAALALVECFKIDEQWLTPICVGAGLVWIAWSIVFWLMCGTREPGAVARWLHRVLFAGSVAELLVAVPCHVIVRRRGECCGGILTGTAICIGVFVMVISIGPSVAFLYYRRWKQITGKNRVIE
jgi:hypothetical protein